MLAVTLIKYENSIPIESSMGDFILNGQMATLFK